MTRTSTSVSCLLIASAILAFGTACGEAGATMTQDELLARMESGSPPVLLDVRSENEYRSGHVPGAVNIPHGQLPARISELGAAEDREVVVYCERGGRARTAEQALRDAGYTRVIHLEGDMSGWRRAELPTQRR